VALAAKKQIGTYNEGLRLAEMAYLSEGQIPEEVGHGAVL